MKITRAVRRAKLRIAALAAAAAAAGLVVPVGQAAAHASAGTAVSSGPKPSIVLVHGAWADSSSWDAVVSQLQHDGYTVYVPPNPLLGLSYDPAFIRDFLHTISGPIILVGHSYGGAVITNAATGDNQVKALVYVDAFAPAQGQTIGQLVSAYPGSCVLPPANVTAQPYPGAPAGAVDVYIKQSVFPSCMANGLPASEAAVLAVTQRPLTSLALAQTSGVPAWQTIPSWAVIGTADHAIPPGTAGHGPAGPRPHHHDPRSTAPVHDLQPRDRHQSDPRGSPRNHLTAALVPASTSTAFWSTDFRPPHCL